VELIHPPITQPKSSTFSSQPPSAVRHGRNTFNYSIYFFSFYELQPLPRTTAIPHAHLSLFVTHTRACMAYHSKTLDFSQYHWLLAKIPASTRLTTPSHSSPSQPFPPFLSLHERTASFPNCILRSCIALSVVSSS